ncbi:MAG: gliding motility-associated C-terminal domain-containing protein [Crocinitomicaceae bacterium]|nr:gliding motility-associated C-terminal domain-containing protein [Crocinitomicaceae bacterium]MDG1777651.1 gliding motility-associated C-terminal domain-containing protein [Crocinitomicaceae bacterium]
MHIKLFLLLTVLFLSKIGSGQELSHSHSIHHAFIENKGQWDENILFKSKFDGGNLWVEQGRFLFHMQDFSQVEKYHHKPTESTDIPKTRQRLIELLFRGANEINTIEKFNRSDTYYNYFVGSDKSRWASNVRGYGEAILQDLYSGIDLKLIEHEAQLKYEFHVKPHVNPGQILLEYSGHEKINIDRKGNLIIKTDIGEIIEQKPYVYQIVNGHIRDVKCEFVLEGNAVSFNLGSYNPNVTLVIDPILVFATYSGSVTDNFGMTATYGHDGSAYSGGMVFGNAYPTPALSWNTTTTVTNVMPTANDPAGTYGVTDVFISKYSSDGSAMLWTCFIGGGNDTIGTETVHSLICDSSDNIYLYGATSSIDFPIQNGYQPTHGGGVSGANFTSNGVHYLDYGTDIFVSKLSADGLSLLGSTYMGGSQNDGVSYNANPGMYDSLTTNYGDQFRGEIMLDQSGNCIVASCTKSNDFPVHNAFQPLNGGMQDGVVFKLSADLSALQWSSYYGGSEKDACYSVKVDESDNVVFSGGTCSNDLLGMGTGWQGAYNGGKTDGFVMKVSSGGTSIINGSYIGTVNYDQAYFVEVDRLNQIYLVGQSVNGSFPVINAGFEVPNSSQFVMRLDSNLVNVVNSTVFGNGNPTINISPSAFLVDICGNIYISGWGASLFTNTALNGMPLTNDAFQSTTSSPGFYLMVIERDFTDILYGSYLGGSVSGEHVDGGTSRFDRNGVVYQSVCGGCGGNNDFPTSTGAWSDQNLSGNCNNLVFKFDFELIPNAEFTVDDNLGCIDFTVMFDNFSTGSDAYLWDFGNGDTTSIVFEPVVTFDSVGVYDVFLYVTDSICLITDTAQITITALDSLSLSTTVDQELCNPTPINLIAYTNGTATNYIWSSDINFSDTLNADLSDSVYVVTPVEAGTYYVQVSNAACSMIDSVAVEFIGSNLFLDGNTSVCLGDTVTITATNSNPDLMFTYSWSSDSILITPSTVNTIDAVPSVSQYLYVSALSSTGCLVEDSIFVNVGYLSDTSVVASASSYTVPEGEEVTLYGQPDGMSYTWSSTTLIGDPNAQNPTVEVSTSTLFTLSVTDGICVRSDTVLVKVYGFICDDPFVYIPNAFSPNGDNENDVLYVRGAAVKKMVFRIYNRWGELVFESFNRLNGWDGQFRGKQLDPDVYDYYLKVTCVDDIENIIKGNVTLLR